MRKHGYNLGGEQSGHLIFLDHSTTGDGTLAALQLLAVMCRQGKPLSELASIFEPVPQTLLNVVVKEKRELGELPEVMKVIQGVEQQLGSDGPRAGALLGHRAQGPHPHRGRGRGAQRGLRQGDRRGALPVAELIRRHRNVMNTTRPSAPKLPRPPQQASTLRASPKTSTVKQGTASSSAGKKTAAHPQQSGDVFESAPAAQSSKMPDLKGGTKATKVEAKTAEQADKQIAFTRRANAEGTKKFKDPTPDQQGPFNQGVAPALKPQPGGKAAPNLNLDNAACLVHGLAPEHMASALQEGSLSSAYRRVGPYGSYSRDADKRGGGGLAVYTRAVGAHQNQWQAMGYGVGSNENKVQLILSPEILNKQEHTWRAAGFDGMGMVPGATKSDLVSHGGKSSGPDAWNLWGKQTESGRNNAFNSTIKDAKHVENNEQLHWEKVPLQNTLKGAVCTSPASFQKLMEIPGAVAESGTRGTIPMGEQRIPVLLTGKDTPLLGALKGAGIANEAGQVR